MIKVLGSRSTLLLEFCVLCILYCVSNTPKMLNLHSFGLESVNFDQEEVKVDQITCFMGLVKCITRICSIIFQRGLFIRCVIVVNNQYTVNIQFVMLDPIKPLNMIVL